MGGPQWDTLLGRAPSGEVVLVEAKALVSELLSPPPQAANPSAERIRGALLEAAASSKASPGLDWSRRFYQYTNRLAHAWFIGEVNALPVHLAFVHFIGDKAMDGPVTRREWEPHRPSCTRPSACAGGCRKYVAEIFIDVRLAVPALV